MNIVGFFPLPAGWAATALFNHKVQEQLLKFKEWPDTFSLGVCNGCQLMALLGWVAPDEDLKGKTGRRLGEEWKVVLNQGGQLWQTLV